MSTTVDEPRTDEPAATEDEKPEEEDGSALFDQSQYDSPALRLAKIDGQSVDRIAVKFSGRVMLDRSDPSDVALFRKLQLGHDIDLLVEAKVSQTAGAGATDREGDLDVVVGEKTLKVHSLMRPVTDEAS